MSYSIVFKTRFVNLPDNRMLFLQRSGCNNDTAGRSDREFSGKIMNREELDQYIDRFESDDSDEPLLKIASKWKTCHEYGEYLRRMLKKAMSWDDLKAKADMNDKCRPYMRYVTKITVRSDEGVKEYTPEEWNDMFYKTHGNYSYQVLSDFAYDIGEIIELMRKDISGEFYIPV